MKCPKLVHTRDQELGLRISFFGDCIKEECAWWEQKIGKCCILRIWIALQDLHEVLHDIEKKMPHEGQFRK